MKTKHALEKVVFGLEPTGNYHKPLAAFLLKRDFAVVFFAGKAVTNNREMMDNPWDKNNTKDSANIADLVSQGKFMYYDYPALPLRDLRNLLSLKRRLKKQEHGLSVRIRNHLVAQYFPELGRYYGEWESMGLSVVRWCLSPAAIASMGYEQFARLIFPGGRITLTQQRRLQAIWREAGGSIGCRAGEALDSYSQYLRVHLSHLESIQIKELVLIEFRSQESESRIEERYA